LGKKIVVARRCPQCGRLLEETMDECPYCGWNKKTIREYVRESFKL